MAPRERLSSGSTGGQLGQAPWSRATDRPGVAVTASASYRYLSLDGSEGRIHSPADPLRIPGPRCEMPVQSWPPGGKRVTIGARCLCRAGTPIGHINRYGTGINTGADVT